MEVKKITKPTLEGDTYLVAQAVNHNAEVLEKVLNRLEKLEEWISDGKPLDFDKFSKSEDMTREEAIDMVRKAFAGWEDEFGRGDDWSKEHKARDMAINALEQELFKDAYIRQVVKERDLAIGQLNELGYSLGEKIRENEKCRGCRYNDGEVHAECVVCNKAESEWRYGRNG